MLTLMTVTQLAHPSGDGRWDGPGPWFILFPITFWILVVAGVVFARRRFGRRPGESVLADSFARGEITPDEFRARRAVLRERRR